MKRAVLLDSSGWVAAAVRGQSRHEEAKAAYTSAVRQGYRIMLTPMVLGESHALFLRLLGRDKAAAALEGWQVDLRAHHLAVGAHRQARREVSRIVTRAFRSAMRCRSRSCSARASRARCPSTGTSSLRDSRSSPESSWHCARSPPRFAIDRCGEREAGALHVLSCLPGEKAATESESRCSRVEGVRPSAPTVHVGVCATGF